MLDMSAGSKALLGLLVMVILVWSAVVGCVNDGAQGDEGDEVSPADEAREVVYSRMDVWLYAGNAPEEIRDVGSVRAGQQVTAVDRDQGWTRVQADGAEGWLPDWYLTAEPDQQVASIQPYFMLTKTKCDLHLTPEAVDNVLQQLDAGRIVEVKATWGEWAYVAIRVYSIPDVQRGWVTLSLLGQEDVTPIEADLPAGTRVYFNDFAYPPDENSTSEITGHDRMVGIWERHGQWVLVSAAGGWMAWVRESDLHYPKMGPGQ